MFSLNVGQTIGALKCISVEVKKHVDGAITETMAFFRLRCDCGVVIEKWDVDLPALKSDWPRDCGCGLYERAGRPRLGRPPMPRHERRDMVHYSLSRATIKFVEERAIAVGTSFSRAAEDLILAGAEKLQPKSKRNGFDQTEREVSE